MKKIKKFDLQYSSKDIFEFSKYCKKILKSGFLAESTMVKSFEQEFSKFTKIKYSNFIGSGTDALELSFKLVKKNKILLQTNNFFAAHVAIENANKTPVYCDIELDTLGIDVDKMENELKKDKEIGGVCIVHTGGIISKQINKIIQICKKYSVLLIEDAAHAHGSFKGKKHAGAFGDIGCFSFFSTKVMTTGEGGMIVTKNKKIHEKVKSLKDFGRPKKDSWIRKIKGSNCKVTEFQAALGLVELKRVKNRIKRRYQLANRIKSQLKNTNFKIYWPKYQKTCSFYKLFIEHKKLECKKIEKILRKINIPLSGQVWPYPLHKQPLYKVNSKKFKNSDLFVKKHFSFPIYPELTYSDIDFMTTNLKHHIK